MLVGILSSLIASALCFVIGWMYRSYQFGGLKRLVVLPPAGSQLNERFYSYFVRQLDRAREEIVVTGEGFEYKGVGGRQKADTYHAAMRAALSRGVHITRIQTARPLHPDWAACLKQLLRDFPTHFHLYIVDNKEFQDVASVCVIDPDRSECLVEFMLSAENDLEDAAVRIASTGVFLHGQRDLARAMKQNISAIKQFKITKKCVTEKDVDQFLNRQ